MISAGLTGNIGAGKSAIAKMLRDRGAEVLDADVLVHGLLHDGGDAVLDVLAAFPGVAADDGRSVDRRALGRIVFADEAARRKLEAIKIYRQEHNATLQEAKDAVDELEAQQRSKRLGEDVS